MSTFWTMLKESVIVQALLTLILWGVIAYRFAIGEVVQPELLNAGMIVLGFYFGAKIQNLVNQTSQSSPPY